VAFYLKSARRTACVLTNSLSPRPLDIRPALGAMELAQMRCHGCNKAFTPHGFSQHVVKTQNVRCRTVHSALLGQAHLDFRSIDGAGHAASSLAPIPSSTLRSPNDMVDDGTSDEETAQPSGGEFAKTCVVDGVVDTNISGYNDRIEDCDAFSDGVDPADVWDAEALEILSRDMNIIPGQESTPEPPSAAISDDPGPPSTSIENAEFGGAPTIIIDRFPFGSPGAPIAGPHENAAMNVPNVMTPGGPKWAPFHSQCDWEIAHWAKTRGPTSSAVTDLLTIPEVRVQQVLLAMALMY
jgi:hypothetical protein